MALREAISKYLPLPPEPIPSNSSKASYGKIKMEYVCIFSFVWFLNDEI
jgi:hypothetical protein